VNSELPVRLPAGLYYAIPRHCQCKYLNFTTIVAVPRVTRFYLYTPQRRRITVKKLLTMVFALALMGSMSFAQSSGDQSSSSQTATSGQNSTSGDQSSSTTTTTTKKHHKKHKKAKGSSTDTSNPSDSSGSTSNPK
jgi:hypothetical protein